MVGTSAPRVLGALLASAAVAAATSAAAQQEGEEPDLAQRHFERGVELYDRGEHEEALASFQTSYDLVPSPNSLLFVARTLSVLERRVEAAEAYARTARDARARAASEPRFAPTADAAEAERTELLARLGRVVVRVVGATSALDVRVGDVPVAREALGLPVVVEPGSVEVVASAADGGSERRTVEAPAGRETIVVLDLSPPPVEPRPPAPALPRVQPEGSADDPGRADGASWSTPVGWTSLAVGAAGWIALAVFGSFARSQHDDLVERCGDDPCPPELGDQVDRGRLYQTLANVGLAVGAVGTLAGLGLLLLVDPAPDIGGGRAQRVEVGLTGTF